MPQITYPASVPKYQKSQNNRKEHQKQQSNIAVTKKLESEVPVHAVQTLKSADTLLLSFLTSALDGRKWLA
jgi:hypothetical protein